ncbi:MAG: DNA polymerase III subunit gamma/tau [Gammaproteobacteria bacterium]|nr:DNA polymerase III subunit gamma/tau [Gammaproteobacteria bacterium]
MTYQVLARKWRPRNFGDMVGQDHVLKTLTHALDNQRVHHAYLFTGTRGVGKTTLARILAKCLNCEEGMSSSPCGKCGACTEIAQGRFIDLIEVDAASRTKVEDTRELLENVQYAPSLGRFKIYLIDEVHMLSPHSFNALLKTLEEPPPHVKFLFATTDPQKLPVTFLSRCLQFNLKNLSPALIEKYMQDILDQEKIKYQESALWQIAASAAGSMRDALTLLDQAISFCEGEVLTEGVNSMLGTPDQDVIYKLLASLCDRDAKSMLQTVTEVAEHAPDFTQLLDGMLATLHRIAIAQVLPDATDDSFGDRQQVQDYAGKFTAEDLQLCYQICVKGKGELSLAPDQRAMFEMLLIRMLVFSPNGVPTIPQQQPSSAPPAKGGSDKIDTGGQVKSEEKPQKELKASDSEKKKSLKPEAHSTRQSISLQTPELPAVSGKKAIVGAKKSQITKVRDENEAARVDINSLNDQSWIDLFPQLRTTGITGNILANCIYNSFAEGKLKLTLDRAHSAVYNEEHRNRIEELLASYFKIGLAVDIDIGELDVESPAARSQRLKQEKIEEMRAQFSQDKKVRELLDRFSGEIITDSIFPIQH